ncbi:MAG: C2H2-type zinc finger protein [Desulfurococcales archaeon]|nr:C2H2-type zinc finger protein [Desulfurococcales archaeon]
MADEYVCDLCGKTFKTEKGLITHKGKVHYSEKKYKCGYCGRTFSSPGELDSHIRAVHFEDAVKKAVEEALAGKGPFGKAPPPGGNKKEGEMAVELNETYLDKLLSQQREALSAKVELVKKDMEREIDKVRQETEKNVSKEVDRLSRDFERLSRAIDEIKSTISSISKMAEESTNGQRSLGERLKELSENLSKYPDREEVKKLVERCISDPSSPVCSLLEELKGKVESVVTKEEVKDLVNECISDPNSPACSLITSMISEVKKPEEGKEEGKLVLDHSSWDEVFSCPECMEGFAKGFSKDPKIMSEFLKKLSEKDREKFVEVVSELLPKEKKSFF